MPTPSLLRLDSCTKKTYNLEQQSNPRVARILKGPGQHLLCCSSASEGQASFTFGNIAPALGHSCRRVHSIIFNILIQACSQFSQQFYYIVILPIPSKWKQVIYIHSLPGIIANIDQPAMDLQGLEQGQF
jgi:hypothetical protein